MSTQQSAESDGSVQALGSRDNFFDSQDAEDYVVGDAPEYTPQYGVSRTAFVAGSFLREHPDARLLCPECFHELERECDLSDPEDFVPPSDVEIGEDEDGEPIVVEMYADHRRMRHCPHEDCGIVSWGGVLADLPKGAFMEVVAHVVDHHDVRDSVAEEIARDAEARKDRGLSDESNMETVVVELERSAEFN